ncbi:MAG: tetratricopeptide repeat protein [Bacteroidota bacterium]
MYRILVVLILVELTALSVSAQSQVAGSKNYGLGGSSVMWLPRSAALFLNPAEVARLHQDEFFLSTHRFSTVPSLSAAHFIPFVGTFVVGIANESNHNWYSAGYGRLVGKHQTVGGALNVIRDGFTRLAVSFGTALHLPDSPSQNSGLHAGLSVVNLSSEVRSPLFGLNVGGAYWIVPNTIRWQAAWQLQGVNRAFLMGTEFRMNSRVSLQAGTLAFKTLSAGVSLSTSYLNADLTVGDVGISLSLNFRIGENARDIRNRYYQRGLEAYDEDRYFDAREHFLTALQYDEYYPHARTMANLTTAVMETTIAVYYREGTSYEERGDYIQAIKMYSQVLLAYPDHENAQQRLNEVQPKLHEHIQQLIVAGDKLRDQKKFNHARRTYERVLDIDPGSQEVPFRITEMETLIRKSIQAHLTRAKAFLASNQIEEARKHYERVLVFDRRNAEAKSGLESVKARRTTEELFEHGKSSFDEANYFEALATFLDVLQSDEEHLDAKSYLERTREILLPKVEDFFKRGLRLYVKEDYRAALEVWNKALFIQPNHQVTLEYSKRTEKKLKALEKLQ